MPCAASRGDREQLGSRPRCAARVDIPVDANLAAPRRPRERAGAQTHLLDPGVAEQLPGRRTLIRVAREAAVDKVARRVRHVHHELGHEPRRDALLRLLLVVAGEGRAAVEQLVGHHAQRPDVHRHRVRQVQPVLRLKRRASFVEGRIARHRRQAPKGRSLRRSGTPGEPMPSSPCCPGACASVGSGAPRAPCSPVGTGEKQVGGGTATHQPSGRDAVWRGPRPADAQRCTELQPMPWATLGHPAPGAHALTRVPARVTLRSSRRLRHSPKSASLSVICGHPPKHAATTVTSVSGHAAALTHPARRRISALVRRHSCRPSDEAPPPSRRTSRPVKRMFSSLTSRCTMKRECK